MFENVVATVLNKFLGDYVANLAQNQLNIGIFSGDIVLTNLQLKKEALDKLNLPLEVFFGYLGRLELHIPWRNLKSQPVKVIIEDLFLLAGPRVETDYDPATEEEREIRAKLEKLETAELLFNSVDSKLTQDVQQESFTTQLVTKIVDNLQVTVKNIHIRFEDSSSNKERMFSVGFTLKELSAVSTDADWKETFIVNPLEAVKKLVKLDSLALYWNTTQDSMQDFTYDEFVKACKETIGDPSHSYVLQPVSGLGKVTLNKKITSGVPKTLLDIFFDAFALKVDYEQYYDILAALAAMSTAQRAMPYMKYRLTTEMKGIEMFRYAVRCFSADIHDRNRRKSWSFVLQRRHDRKNYVKIYSKKLLGAKLSLEETTDLAELERRSDYDDLLYYRSLGRELARRSAASTPKKGGSWVWSWMGYKASATSLVKDEDIKELYETIDYSESQYSDTTNIPADSQLVKVNFKLGEGSFSLAETPSSTDSVLSLVFTELFAKFIQRPKTIGLILSLQDLSLMENFVKDSMFRELVKFKGSRAGSPTSTGSPLLRFSFDQMAKNPNASAEVDLVLRPLQIVVNMLAVEKLTSFLLNKKTLPLIEALKAEAQKTFETVGVKTRAGLQMALESHKGTDISVKIDAPIILLPDDPTDITKSVFAIDLGRLTAFTELVSSENKQNIQNIKRQLTDEETIDFFAMLYDKINVSLSKVGIYYAENLSSWWDIYDMIDRSSLDSFHKIISDIDIKVLVENCILSTAANLAKTKVSGSLPQIEVFMSDLKVKKLLRLLDNFPKSGEPTPSVSIGDMQERRKSRGKKSIATVPALNNSFKDMKLDSEPKRMLGRTASKSPRRKSGASESDDEFFDAIDDPDNEVDSYNMLLDFVIKHIHIHMSKSHDLCKESKVLSFDAERVCLHMMTYGTLNLIDFGLGNISLREYSQEPSGSFLLNGSQSDTDLLSISVQIVDPLNSDFTTVYKEIERSVRVEFRSFIISAEPSKIYALAKFALQDYLLPNLGTSNSEQLAPEPIVGDSTELFQNYQPKTEIAINLAGFQILLDENQKSVAKLQAEALSVVVQLVGKKLEISGNFSTLSFVGFSEDDPTPTKLIFFDGDSVAKFSYETGCAESKDYLEGSNILRLRVGSLVLVYDADPYSCIAKSAVRYLGILDLLDNKNDVHQGMKVGDTGNDRISAETTVGFVPVSRGPATYLHIELQSPVVVIPSKVGSSVLTLNLGRLLVNNVVTLSPDFDGIDQLFSITLTEISVDLLNSRCEDSERFLLRPFSVPITVRLTSNACARNYAEVEVDGVVDKILADISEDDYNIAVGIVFEVLESLTMITSALPKPKASPDGNDTKELTISTNEENFLFDADIRFEGFELVMRNASDESKVSLGIHGIEISAVQHSARGLGFEVCVESVFVKDDSDADQIFKDLFLIGMAAEGFTKPIIDSKKQLLFRMDKKNDGETIINIYLESPRIFVLFDSIFYMIYFFTAGLPKSNFDNKVNTSNTVTDTENSSDTNPPLSILLNLLDARIFVVEDVKSPNTETFSLSIASVAFSYGKELIAAIENMSASIYQFGSPAESMINIFERLGISLKLTKDVEGQSSFIDIVMKPLNITLSFRDIQLLQRFAENIQKAQSRYLVPTEESDLEKESVSTSSKNVEPRIHELVETGNVILDEIRITIVDDSAATILPLLEVTLSQMSCSLKDWSSKIKLDLSATIASNCFNPNVSFWEPLIEPWTFKFMVGPNEIEPKADSTLMLTSDQGLDIVIVHHSLERILSMFSKLDPSTNTLKLRNREMVAPYLFGNYLDIPIMVKSEDNNASKSLEPQAKSEFSFEDWRSLRKNILQSKRTVSIDFNDVFQEISNVDVNSDGFWKMNLVPCESVDEDRTSSVKEPRKFFIESFLLNGVRHIDLRERIIFVNDTELPLILTFSRTDVGKSLPLEPLNKVCVLPWLETSKVMVAPLQAKMPPFTKELELRNISKLHGTVLSTATGIGKDETFLNILVSIIHHDRFEMCDLRFSEPLIFENLLPCELYIQFSQGNLKKVISLTEGATKRLFDIDPSNSFSIASSIPDLGFYSTGEENPILMKRSVPLVMQNEDCVELKIMLTKSFDAKGRLLLSFAPYYLIVNQTNMVIQIQSETHFTDKKGRSSQLFSVPCIQDEKPFTMFSHPNVSSVKNRVRVRVADSVWTKPLSFEAVGSEIEFDCNSMITQKWYNIGAYVGVGQGKFAGTKIIYISERYFAVNDTDREISLKAEETSFSIPSKSQSPIHLNPANLDQITIKSSDAKEFSTRFDIKNVGSIYVREDSMDRLLRIGRTLQSPSLYVSISETKSWPFQIRNLSTKEVKFHQKDVSDKQYTCLAKSNICYSWDDLSFKQKTLVMSIDDKETSLDLSEIGHRSHMKFKDASGRSNFVDIKIKADGPAVIVEIHDRFASETEVMREDEQGNAAYDEAFENVILLRLPHIAISLIGPDLVEFMQLYVKDMELRYAMSKQFISYGVTVKWMQIDNQSFDWEHPMLLYPAVLSKSRKELQDHPFLSLGIIQSKDRSYGVTYYKYCGLLLQELSLELGEELLRRIINFADLSYLTAQRSRILIESDYGTKKYEICKDSSEILFFEFFQLHPIKVNITFSRTEESGSEEEKTSYNPLSALVNVMTMTVGNISDAPLKFNALVFENILAQQSSIIESVVDHYKQEGLTQVHKVLGSADFLGNPVGLFNTLGSGVTDLFYEPYQGFVSDRPQDIGIGFARGGASLVKKTISGFSGTLSKFTGSLAKGLSAATLDHSYQQKRRVDRAKNKPKHALSGVSTGVQQLYSGVKSGFTGIVDKPLEGAKEGGVGGFFKGVGVGLMGVITKPVVGLIDMTTSMTEGIQNSADGNEGSVSQFRFPRVVPFDKRVKRYDYRESFGQSILANVVGVESVGREYYIGHVDVPGDNSIVILTDKRIIYASLGKLKISWEVSLTHVENVTSTIDSIVIKVRDDPPRIKVIPLTDTETQIWFIKICKNQLKI